MRNVYMALLLDDDMRSSSKVDFGGVAFSTFEEARSAVEREIGEGAMSWRLIATNQYGGDGYWICGDDPIASIRCIPVLTPSSAHSRIGIPCQQEEVTE